MDLQSLTLHEKICQLMVVKANPKEHIKKFGSIKAFMERYPVGGIFICNEMIYDKSYTLERIAEAIAEYQKYSKVPLLVAADAEIGVTFLSDTFTLLPPPMALGSARDAGLAYDYGAAIAKEGRSVGVNWTFAPVCDLNINKFSEIVGTRSISNDPALAAEMLPQVVKGFQDNGMLTTGKHFPGDGCDARNQHIVGTVNDLSREQWMESYGKVYKAVFAAGLSSVMVGHISVPAFQNDAVNGVYPPASLSADCMRLLKDTLGFKGVAITDAMDMGGFVRWVYSRREAEVEAFKAGLDMFLWPRVETADLIEQGIQDGSIPMSRLDDAIERIAYLKSQLEPQGFGPIADVTHSAFSQRVRDQLADRASTLAVNTLHTIPVDKAKIQKVRLIVSIAYFLNGMHCYDASMEALKAAFEQRGCTVDLRREWDVYLEDFEAGEIDRDYDLIVYCAFSDSALPLPARELVNLHSAQRFDEDKTVVMVLGTPHYIKEYFPTAHTVIHTYPDRTCIEDAVGGIFGEREFKGVLPLK